QALDPPADPGNDATAYMQISGGLFEHHHYGAPGQRNPNDWSPGAPLLYAAVYFVTGGVHVKAALLLLALLGTITIALTYLLARVAWRHPRGRRAGLLPGVAAGALVVVAFCAVLAPWTARNAHTLHRFVPVTTGGGKALFVATYLPGKGRQQLVKRQLIARYY